MIIKLGDIEFHIHLINGPEETLVSTPLRDLLRGASVSIFAPALSGIALAPPETGPPIPEPIQEATPEPLPATLSPLQILKTINFSNHTITMISSRLFGIRVPGGQIEKQFEPIREAASRWSDRPLKSERIWAVFLAPIQPPKLGRRFVAVGLNDDNQQVILEIAKTEAELYKRCSERGLAFKAVEFAMLSFEMSTKIFREYFPKAEIGRDWQEFAELSERPADKEKIRVLMVNPDKRDVAKKLKALKGPDELLTYFNFDRQLWRVLRTASNISKIDAELRSHTKSLKDVDAIDFASLWTLLRVQYQWLRIPVTAKQFDSFRHIKPQVLK